MARPSREYVDSGLEQSFRLLLTPNLNDQYYWHFHPEFEICYVEGASGTRHIGDHISRYEGSDLVFIGPYIPHLNFDYGVRTQCETVVVQMKEDFLGSMFLQAPELRDCKELFHRAKSALAFSGETKARIGRMMRALPDLSPFNRLMALLEILQVMSASSEVEALKAEPIANEETHKEQARLQRIHRMVEDRFPQTIETADVARELHITTAAFCRYMQRQTGATFTDYVNKYRINQAKKFLLMGRNVTEACYESGFENLSHFNRTFKKFAGMNPGEFRKQCLAI
jgi:AraC-like DNA-binding protein